MVLLVGIGLGGTEFAFVDGSYQRFEETVFEAKQRNAAAKVLHTSSTDSVDHHAGFVEQIWLLYSQLSVEQWDAIMLFPVEARHLVELNRNLCNFQASVAASRVAFVRQARV